MIGGLLVAYGQSGPPAGYYDPAENLTGPELRTALHDLIDDHHVIPYASSGTDTHDAVNVLDEDPANTNNVILIYSLRSEPKTNWPSWNREHLWPNSLGADYVEPAYSDLHYIRPCDLNVNSSRGNKYYDWSDTNSPSYAFPAYVEAPLCSTDSDSWEPDDSVKGDIARSLFYLEIRYEGDSGEPDLVLTDHTEFIDSSTNFMGRLTTLIQWHQLDPVDDAERTRNDKIYSLYQANRNPFVDHPEWAQEVFVPRISILTSGTVVRASWPATELDIGLASADTLTNPWEAVINTPSSNTNGFYVDLPANATNRFFRLQSLE